MSNLAYIFSFFLLTVIILWCFQQLFFRLLNNSFGGKSIYISAIIGTPIHELSHAFMCIVFRHKINEIKLFSPNKNGTLGYVNHSYNNRNAWHMLGNLFIGIAPLIGGAFSVYFLTLYVMPSGNQVIHLFSWQSDFLKNIDPITDISNLLLSFNHLLFLDLQNKPVQLLIWAYLSAAISLHLMPSKEDLKGALIGFFYFLSICIILVALKHFIHVNLSFFIDTLQDVLHVFFMTIILAICLVSMLLLSLIIISSLLRILSLPFRRYCL
ncbi:MAG: hypothetical protein KAH18_12760 [Psychromonas sp.]|nr:hypothetical protein [Psychromonas sp.]